MINEDKGKKKLCANFAQPDNYRPVLERYPKLKVCLAHFGSERYWKEFLDHPENKGNWFTTIRQMIDEYDNLYTDLSFTMNNRSLFSLIKVILEDEKLSQRVLFGSDYYMVETTATERRFGLDLRAFIGEKKFKKIAVDNPERYLSIS